MECRQDESNVQNAVWDDGAELYEVFDSILGLGHRLDYETTPEILYLCERAVSDVDAANKVVKNKYKRMRPYVTFKEESLTPENDAKKAGPSVIHQATPAEVICSHWCFVRLCPKEPMRFWSVLRSMPRIVSSAAITGRATSMPRFCWLRVCLPTLYALRPFRSNSKRHALSILLSSAAVLM